MYSRWLLAILFLAFWQINAWAKPDVVKFQLMDNVEAGFTSYQAYNIPASAIAQIERASGQAIDMQILVATVISRASFDDEESEDGVQHIANPVDWLDLAIDTLCLTAQSKPKDGDVKNNLCLVFSHAMPFPNDYSVESQVVNLTLHIGKARREDNTTYLEVVDVQTY